MITVISQDTHNGTALLRGLSTDTKPIDFIDVETGRITLGNGSTFEVINTGELFMYDADGRRWYQLASSSALGVTSVNGMTGAVEIPTVELDTTLTVAGEAADAKATGDAINDAINSIGANVNTTIGDLNELTTTAKTNLVAAINEAASTGGGQSYTFDTAPTQGSSNPVTSDGIYEAITAIVGDSSIPKLDVPYSGEEAIAPFIVRSIFPRYQLKTDTDQIGKNISSVTKLNGGSTSTYTNDIIKIPEGAKHVEYTTYRSGSTAKYGCLFLDANEIIIKGVYVLTGCSQIARKRIPEGAVYFVYAHIAADEPLIHFTSDKPAHGITSLGLHTIPLNEGVVNGIKNARQVTDFTWSAVMTIPRTSIRMGGYGTDYNNNVRDEFTAHVEYKGAPYSDPTTDYKQRLLFTSTPLEPFITANQNAASIQGVESTYNARYGSYYGTCCTGLTSYALNLPYMYSNRYTTSGYLSPVFSIQNSSGVFTDFNELMLLDVLQVNGHCLIVTDIRYNDDGEVALIEMSEETRAGLDDATIVGGQRGGIARRYTATPETICSMYASYQVVRYRYQRRITYTPTVYSPTDEGNMINFPHYPLLPYRGNNCCLDSGATCKLLIGDGNSQYNKVIVKKNGEDFATYDITSSDTYVNVVCDADCASYTAALYNYDGDTYVRKTRTCEWYVKDVPVVETTRVSDSTIEFTVKTKSDQFYPWFGTVDSQTTTDGSAKLVWSYDQSYEDSTGYNVFVFSITRTGSSSITQYEIGLRSDKYGAWYIDGTVA